MTIPEAAEALGISRGLAYELARRGELPVLRLGSKRLVVPRQALEELLSSKSRQKVVFDVGRQ
jgi:excisionase family DNA binding protein